MNAGKLVGKDIVDASGKKIGEIDDIVMDKQTRQVQAVIGTGGFLGLGEKKHVVSLSQLQRTSDEDKLTLQGAAAMDSNAASNYDKDRFDSVDRDKPLSDIRG
jgi:hypothetical protein